MYAETTVIPRNLTLASSEPFVYTGFDKEVAGGFFAIGIVSAGLLWALARLLCCAGRSYDRRIEMRKEQAWQERQEAREARRTRDGFRYAVPRCHVAKPPLAHVDEIEMA